MARGNFTRINEEDMMILAKAVFSNSNQTLAPFSSFTTKHLKLGGPYADRGVFITVLARGLNFNVSNVQALEGPHRLGFTTLNACGMVRKINGGFYFSIPRADHLIAAPLPNGLFSIEDGHLHYDA